MRLRPALLFVFAALPLLAGAEPARYYWWQGKDRTVCAQTSPGKGWTRVSGAFVRPDCSF
ncbi:hypothetical protein ACIPL1_13800 [Pseudomonas sp. NPDC090202]|uniref:hypothetical protein n=1 Tax=unclassified Pseudomonas TaxID=196821 RepID=UPI00380B0438